MKLYVGNLMNPMSNAELRDLFSSCGTVVSAQIFIDYYTRQRKEFGFVRMSNRNEGRTAIKMMNGQVNNNRRLVVREIVE